MAIVDVQLQGESKKYFTPEERQFLSSAIRGEASHILGDQVEILSQAKFRKLVQANSEGCSEAGCFAGFVAEIGVDLGMQPTISYAFGKLKMTLEVADSRATIGSKTLSAPPTEAGKNELGESALIAARELFHEVKTRLGLAATPPTATVTEKVQAKSSGLIPKGCYDRGSTSGPKDELPVKNVCIDAILMDTTEVTQIQYQSVMGTNPSYFSKCGDLCPVENVSWVQADSYCKKVGKRLPTEAEWEIAARGGMNTIYGCGKSSQCVKSFGWYNENSNEKTHPVAQKTPNAYGLYDMMGNVREWVADWYNAEEYSKTFQSNPEGPKSGPGKVVRGGSWYGDVNATRPAYRYYEVPNMRRSFLGFRCVEDQK